MDNLRVTIIDEIRGDVRNKNYSSRLQIAQKQHNMISKSQSSSMNEQDSKMMFIYSQSKL